MNKIRSTFVGVLLALMANASFAEGVMNLITLGTRMTQLDMRRGQKRVQQSLSKPMIQWPWDFARQPRVLRSLEIIICGLSSSRRRKHGHRIQTTLSFARK